MNRKNLKHRQAVCLRLIFGFSLPHDLGTLSLTFGSPSNYSFKNLWLPVLAAKSNNLSLRAMRNLVLVVVKCVYYREHSEVVSDFIFPGSCWNTAWSGGSANLAQLFWVHPLVAEPFVWILSYWSSSRWLLLDSHWGQYSIPCYAKQEPSSPPSQQLSVHLKWDGLPQSLFCVCWALFEFQMSACSLFPSLCVEHH